MRGRPARSARGLLAAAAALLLAACPQSEPKLGLSVIVFPPEGGSVQTSPSGGAYDAGAAVSLTAAPASGYVFAGWYGDAAGLANPLQAVVDDDLVVAAEFRAVAAGSYALAVIATPAGGGQVAVSPGGGAYAPGTALSLTPTPAAGYAFVGWGGDLAGSASPGSLTALARPMAVEARFAPLAADQASLSVAVSPPGSGSVAASPSGPFYDLGSVVQLTATPESGFEFVGWTGDAAGAANPVNLTLSGANAATAVFRPADGTGAGQGVPLALSGTVETVAGVGGVAGFADGQGVGAMLNRPTELVRVGAYVYLASIGDHRIRRWDPATGRLDTFAGTGETGHRDGPAGYARFSSPLGICSDGTYLYVTETGNNDVRRIALADGAVATIAGTAGVPGSADNAVGLLATFNYPTGIEYVGGASPALYLADYQNHTVRRIGLAAGFPVTTPVGSAGVAGGGDGTGAAARFYNPHDLAWDGTYLWVADYSARTVRRFDPVSLAVVTVAGAYNDSQTVDGSYSGTLGSGSSGARFQGPTYISYANGRLNISDHPLAGVRTMTTTAPYTVGTLEGGNPGGFADGPQASARFSNPCGLIYDGSRLLLADEWNHAVRSIDPATGTASTVLGIPTKAGSADGAGVGPLFNTAYGLCSDGTWIYIADYGNNCLRRADPATGAVTLFAGGPGDPGTGNALSNPLAARFGNPIALATDGAMLYVADHSAHTIRSVNLATGEVATLAGSPGASGYVDGTGATARFTNPAGLALLGGFLYVADSNNHAIRRIDPATGDVTTLAGGRDANRFDDGPNARFNTPLGLATDGVSLFVADTVNRVVRRLDPATGAATVLAGQAGVVGTAYGPAPYVRFRDPRFLACDGAYLYLTDATSHSVSRIAIADGTTTSVAGADMVAGYADGVGAAARFNTPEGICVAGGSLYLFDRQNYVLRRIL
jgi:uncharacterized repeat protein (TIGR02543 family)